MMLRVRIMVTHLGGGAQKMERARGGIWAASCVHFLVLGAGCTDVFSW